MMETRKAIWLLCFPWFLSCYAKEDPKSACDSAPCQNGAQCIDVTYPGGPLAFKCACKEGFDGLTCQKRIDLCADDPCQNGGVCSQRGEHYHCACPEGFHGKNCETSAVKKDPCAEKPCGPHGICEVVNGQVSCECLQGFSGPKCETSEKTETEVSVSTNTELDEESWVIRDILIAMLFFVVLFAAILFFVCCHCYRVWNQRSALRAVQEAQKAAGKDTGPVVGWVDLSNQMCYDFFCCCFPRQEKNNLGDRRFADPDNITGVIVPLKDYNSLIRNGYMPLCYRESTDKANIDHMAPEVERASMRGQPIQIHYTTEPVKYATNGSVMTREDAKAPAVCNYERGPTLIQTIPHCQDVMDPVTEQTCEMYPGGQQNLMPQQMQRGMAPMSEPMALEANGMQPQSYYSNTGITREPLYYNYRKQSMPDQTASNMSADKKISRSQLYAQHGKSFTPINTWNQSKFMETTQEGNQMFPQSTNQNHAQSEPNLDTFKGTVYNSTPLEPARPDFYSTGMYPIPPATPYPWIPQPFAYPYAFPYPPQNNIQDHSSSAGCSTQPTPREKIRKNSDRNLSPHPTAQQKLSHGAVKGHAVSRRQNVGNALCGESKMDNLQFTDDDAVESEATLIDLSEDDGRHPYVETDTDEEAFDRVDDDGYGSTNRLSESDAGSRVRHSQSHREYSDETSRYYIPRKQKQRIQQNNKLHPRSSQPNSMHNAKPRRSKLSEQDACKKPLCKSEHTEPSIYQDSEGSTSAEEREDYCTVSGPVGGQNSGSRTQPESHRQLQTGGSVPNKLMRRGDLWSGQTPTCLTPLKYVSKGDDIQPLKSTAPKKVKGILKNSSHGLNYNRSAYSLNARKIKDVTVGSRRRPQRYRESD